MAAQGALDGHIPSPGTAAISAGIQGEIRPAARSLFFQRRVFPERRREKFGANRLRTLDNRRQMRRSRRQEVQR